MASRAHGLQQFLAFKQQIEECFESCQYWEYEKFLGNGSFGITVLVREIDRYVTHQNRLAIKLVRSGLGLAAVNQLKTEISVLKKLHGAIHIVKILASCESVLSLSNDIKSDEDLLEDTFQKFGKLSSIPPHTAFTPLKSIMDGPALALEYLDKGDFITFKMGLDKEGKLMPNRVIWSMFLCLIRACIGMAYPLGKAEGAPLVLETIPTDGTQPGSICHSDIGGRNIMLASEDDQDEHNIGHMFKLIDFGCAVEYQPPKGPRENLYDIARHVMLSTISVVPINLRSAAWKGELSRAGNILPALDNPNDDPFPQIDMDLRDLIARCMYVNSAKRPSLQEALDMAKTALSRAPDTFPDPDIETDDAIREFWQEHLHDVPAEFR